MTTSRNRFDIAAGWVFAAVAACYVVYTLTGLYEWTPRTLYADQWRQYVYLIEGTFPHNVTAPDNGHRPVLPNFVAWADLRWLGGDHWLQLAVGWAALIVAAGTIAWLCARDRATDALARRTAAFVGVCALFWFGNARMQAHTGELMHVYPTLACTVGAIACSLRAAASPHGARWVAAALALAFVATNTFGFGIAAFFAIVATLVFARAPARLVGASVAGVVAAALYYLSMRGGDSVSDTLKIAPLDNAWVALRWLGGPLNFVTPWAWNESAAFLVPSWFVPAAQATSATTRALVGDIAASAWPQALVGIAGTAGVLVMSWRTWRAPQAPTRTRVVGLGIAWFGLAAAGIISLSRLGYFEQFPQQIYADRYQPWPTFFWLGVALIALGRRARDGESRGWARALAASAFVLALVAWPAERGGRIYAALVYGLVNHTAAGSAVGVVDDTLGLGETLPEEFLRGLPVVRAAGIAPFSWPEARALGAAVPADAHVLDGATIVAQPVRNLLDGGAGMSVDVKVAHKPVPERAVLLDAQRQVIGVVARDPRAGMSNLTGYARGDAAPAAVAVLR